MDMKMTLFLNRLLSFKSLAVGLFAARLLKYFIFGIDGFGRHWGVEPALSDHVEFIWNHCTHPYVELVVLAFILDRIVGPLFFRQEVSELETILYG